MSQLRENRLLLLAALLLLGTAVGILAAALTPRGSVRARSTSWGPSDVRPSDRIEGYGADRSGGECGLRRLADGATRSLRGCHAYTAPAVVEVGDRTIAVWEHENGDIAVSAVHEDLSLGDTELAPRPRTARGTLLPRERVRADAERLAVWYAGDRVVSFGVASFGALSAWPGGPLEVAGVRLGPRAFVLLFGTVALIAFYLAALGWTLGLPGRLAAHRRRGRLIEATLPEKGRSIVLEGRPFELDLSGAWAFGGRVAHLAGRRVTLVLPESRRLGDAYRRRGRLPVTQIWVGGLSDAMAHARAVRTGTAAVAVMATAILLLGLDAYLAL